MKKEKLNLLIKQIFIKYGLNLQHAKICADALINAELVGAPTHGLSRLKMYCDRISKKVINPRPKIKVKKISSSISHVNAIIVLVLLQLISPSKLQLLMQKKQG